MSSLQLKSDLQGFALDDQLGQDFGFAFYLSLLGCLGLKWPLLRLQRVQGVDYRVVRMAKHVSRHLVTLFLTLWRVTCRTR